MDEIKQFRNFLGSVADGYNDAQLAELRVEMQAMAELLLDIYLDKKSRKRRRSQRDPFFDALEDLP